MFTCWFGCFCLFVSIVKGCTQHICVFTVFVSMFIPILDSMANLYLTRKAYFYSYHSCTLYQFMCLITKTKYALVKNHYKFCYRSQHFQFESRFLIEFACFRLFIVFFCLCFSVKK